MEKQILIEAHADPAHPECTHPYGVQVSRNDQRHDCFDWLETGLCDHSHFTRNVKKQTGLLPSAYRTEGRINRE